MSGHPAVRKGVERHARDGSRTTHDLLDAAWEQGINFVDTANSYGGGRSERWIGEWLADHDREGFVIASKVTNAYAVDREGER